MADRKKPGWLFWATVVLVGVPLLYVMSFGPACWIVSRSSLPAETINTGYRPVIWAWERSPDPVVRVIWWYVDAGVPESHWSGAITSLRSPPLYHFAK